MNANDLTFGIEIETVAPQSAIDQDGLRIGAYHHGIQVPYLPRGWKAERDGSIDASRGGHPCEIVSPILRGAGRSETVEFRVFSGSLNAIKVCGWIQVCLGLVERALNGKRTPTWNPKPLSGGWKKAGEGASEAERLMGYLAWGRGYARIHGGCQYGWISDAIPQEQVKSEFRRLAAKYDAMA